MPGSKCCSDVLKCSHGFGTHCWWLCYGFWLDSDWSWDSGLDSDSGWIRIRWRQRVFRFCVPRPSVGTRTRIADRCGFVGSNYRWSGVFFIVTAVMTTVGTYFHVQLIAFNLLDFISVSPWRGLRSSSFCWGPRRLGNPKTGHSMAGPNYFHFDWAPCCQRTLISLDAAAIAA